MELILLAVIAYGIFKSSKVIRNLCKKSAAAVALQRLLEHEAKHGLLIGSPARLAHNYVEDAWRENPKLLKGNRLHKLAVVICCLSIAALKLNTTEDANESSILSALGNALEEAKVNGHRHPLRAIDRELIAKGHNIYRILESRRPFPNDHSVSKTD